MNTKILEPQEKSKNILKTEEIIKIEKQQDIYNYFKGFLLLLGLVFLAIILMLVVVYTIDPLAYLYAQ